MVRSHRRTTAAAILSACMFTIAMHAAEQAVWAQDKTAPSQPGAKKPTSAIPSKVGPPKPIKGRRRGIPQTTVVLEPGQSPRAEFENPVYDFGRRRAGEKVDVDFWFKNVGTGPLEILKVKPGCSCTTGGKHDRIVQPNERGRIPIVFNTKKFSGPITKTVTVHSNAPGNQAKTLLKIKGDIWQPVETMPRSIAFGRVTMELLDAQQPSKKLAIVNNMDTPIAPSNLRSSNSVFKPTITTIDDGKKYELSVSVVQPIGRGPITGDIMFDTGNTEMPTVKVRASVYVAALLDVSPSEIVLPTNRKNDIRRRIYVRNNTTQKTTLGEIKVSNPALSTTVTERREGMAFQVTLLIPATYKREPCGDWITIPTSHPRMPELRIPIKKLEAPDLPPPELTAAPTTESTARAAAIKIKADRATGAATAGS